MIRRLAAFTQRVTHAYSRRKVLARLSVFVLVCTSFALGYGAITHAWPYFGRNSGYGYFYNLSDGSGTDVLPRRYDGNTHSIPDYVNSAAELIAFIDNAYYAGPTIQDKIGAAFIMDSMVGGDHTYPLSAEEIIQWRHDMQWYEGNGWINWAASYSHTINSYYQGTGSGGNYTDDAFFSDSGTSTSIIFTGPGGWTRYAIRRQCANPVGTGGFTQIAHGAFNVTGRTYVTSPTASAGDTITFYHYLRDDGPVDTWPTSITALAQQTSPTFATTAGPKDVGTLAVWVEISAFDTQVFIPPGTLVGTQFCQRVLWNPVSSASYQDGIGEPACVTVVGGNYTLTPSINVTVNGAASAGSTAEVNDVVAFRYAVNNSGPDSSASATCTIYGLTKPGPYTAPTPSDSTSDAGYTQPAHGCPRIFPVGSTTMVTETITVPAGSLNKTICRSLYINPSSNGGGSANTESCVRIVAKPYVRAYGGDLSAGNGLSSSSGTCSSNPQAAIVGWNRGGANGYAGAGAQYAILALNQINDFSSALGNGGGAATPSGLAFANTSTSGSNFGGNFGSMPCIPDHYATKPASTLALTANVGGMVNGSYSGGSGGSSTVTLGGGSVNPSNRISVYIDGNVYITSNITYSGSWSIATMPMFRIIVRGNIYIDNDVSQLDGLYVAQRNGSSGGTIYTCTTGASALAPSDPSFFAQCDNQKLTVNGAFVANQVQLGRTLGTLSQATAAQSGATGFSAEVFNYSPTMWIPQPTSSAGAANYDSITTLPPIL